MKNLIYKKIDTEKNDLYKILDNSNNSIQIKTGKMYLPFGLNVESSEKLNLKIEFDNIRDNTQQQHLYNLINNIEKQNIKFLNCKSSDYIKLIKIKNKKYYPNIVVKILTKNNKPFIKINYKNKDDYLKTLYDLPEKSYISLILEIGNLWKIKKKNNQFIYGMSIYAKNITVY